MTKHVPDLEHCQELDRLCKEKGIVVPETEYQWQIGGKLSGETTATLVPTNRPPTYGSADSAWRFIPAPLVSEQGEWLPWSIDTGCVNFDNCPSWHRVTYYRGEHYLEQTASTEANARQKMLNYLIAEGIITTL